MFLNVGYILTFSVLFRYFNSVLLAYASMWYQSLCLYHESVMNGFIWRRKYKMYIGDRPLRLIFIITEIVLHKLVDR